MTSEERDTKADPAFAAVRRLVPDLFVPSPVRYWLDMLTTWAIGVTAFWLVPHWGWTSPLAAVSFVVAAFALYRASVFVHEIAHLEGRKFRWFRVVWDLLCGMPMLVPSFLYERHRDHHVIRSYATDDDAEYFAFAVRGRGTIVLFVVANALVPLAAYFRLVVLTPLGWLSPTVARLAYTHASALAINPAFEAPPLQGAERREFRVREASAFFYVAALSVLAVVGSIPIARVAEAYAVIAAVSLLNALRILVAHKYEHAEHPVSMRDQILDSNNFPHSPWLANLWAPVGLRFHALHHLFPRMPYHALAEAHRRLSEGLPRDAWYHTTEQPGLCTALVALWRRAGRAAHAEPGAHTESSSR